MKQVRQVSGIIIAILLLFAGVSWVVSAAPAVEDSRLSSLAGITVMTRGGIDDVLVSWRLTGSLTGDLDYYQVSRYDQTANQTLLLHSRTLGSQFADSSGLIANHVYCYSVIAYNHLDQEIGRSSQSCLTFGRLSITAPNQTVPPGTQDVPVTISLENGNGLCAVALQIEVEYDNMVVTPVVDSEGDGKVLPTPFTAGWSFRANVGNPNTVKIAAITTDCIDLHGSGNLFDLYFDVIGSSGDISPLTFVTGLTATVIYDEDDLLNTVPLNLTHGELQIQVAYIRGDVNGDEVVNAVDSLMALMIASGELIPTERQVLACDVNGDTVCSAPDSSVILCYAVESEWSKCGLTGRALAETVSSDSRLAAEIRVGTVAGAQGDRITVPVDISNAAELGNGLFDFAYNSAELTFLGIQPRGLSDDFQLHAHDNQNGLLSVALASYTPLNSNDSGLFDIVFKINNRNVPLTSDVMLGSYLLGDNIGRDFVTSSLQRTTDITRQPSTAKFLSYIPIIQR